MQNIPSCVKDCFVGIVSTNPIGRVEFNDRDANAQPWPLRRLLIATESAHLLESLTPYSRMVFWGVFSAMIVLMVAVDLFCLGGRTRVVQLGAALRWTLVWVTVALVFAMGMYVEFGRGPAIVWLTAYLLEKFLSVDNLFVFLTIFANFRIPLRFQHKVWAVDVGSFPGSDMGHWRSYCASRCFYFRGCGVG